MSFYAHVAILLGLTMTLYAAIYFLFPILTNGAKLYSEKLAVFHFWAHLLGSIGMGAFMGMVGPQGMLRRTLYANGEYYGYMLLAALSGTLLLLAFLAFFFNIVMSLGLKGVLGVFTPAPSTPRTRCRRRRGGAEVAAMRMKRVPRRQRLLAPRVEAVTPEHDDPVITAHGRDIQTRCSGPSSRDSWPSAAESA